MKFQVEMLTRWYKFYQLCQKIEILPDGQAVNKAPEISNFCFNYLSRINICGQELFTVNCQSLDSVFTFQITPSIIGL